MTWTERMRDSAYATDISASWTKAISGYLGGPNAFRTWTKDDWARFPGNRKLPIWVGGFGGEGEGFQALQALYDLAVPVGVWTALDMEARVDETYVTAFGGVLNHFGYKVWVYGSAATVFGNPPLNGYWVADYVDTGPFMYERAGVEIRATQYADPAHGSGGPWDSSTVQDYTYYDTPWWV